MAEEQEVHTSEVSPTPVVESAPATATATAPAKVAVAPVKPAVRPVAVPKKLSPQAARAAELVRIKRKKHRHAMAGRNTRG